MLYQWSSRVIDKNEETGRAVVGVSFFSDKTEKAVLETRRTSLGKNVLDKQLDLIRGQLVEVLIEVDTRALDLKHSYALVSKDQMSLKQVIHLDFEEMHPKLRATKTAVKQTVHDVLSDQHSRSEQAPPKIRKVIRPQSIETERPKLKIVELLKAYPSKGGARGYFRALESGTFVLVFDGVRSSTTQLKKDSSCFFQMPKGEFVEIYDKQGNLVQRLNINLSGLLLRSDDFYENPNRTYRHCTYRKPFEESFPSDNKECFSEHTRRLEVKEASFDKGGRLHISANILFSEKYVIELFDGVVDAPIERKLCGVLPVGHCIGLSIYRPAEGAHMCVYTNDGELIQKINFDVSKLRGGSSEKSPDVSQKKDCFELKSLKLSPSKLDPSALEVSLELGALLGRNVSLQFYMDTFDSQAIRETKNFHAEKGRSYQVKLNMPVSRESQGLLVKILGEKGELLQTMTFSLQRESSVSDNGQIVMRKSFVDPDPTDAIADAKFKKEFQPAVDELKAKALKLAEIRENKRREVEAMEWRAKQAKALEDKKDDSTGRAALVVGATLIHPVLGLTVWFLTRDDK